MKAALINTIWFGISQVRAVFQGFKFGRKQPPKAVIATMILGVKGEP